MKPFVALFEILDDDVSQIRLNAIKVCSLFVAAPVKAGGKTGHYVKPVKQRRLMRKK